MMWTHTSPLTATASVQGDKFTTVESVLKKASGLHPCPFNKGW